MKIGMKVYFDVNTGNVIVITPEMTGPVMETTKEQDFKLYKALSELVPDNVDFVQFEYGRYQFDRFEGKEIVRIDLETNEPLFSKSVEEGQEPSLPVNSIDYQMNELKQELAKANERNDKLEEENTLNQVALMELHAMMTSLMPEE